MQVCADTTRRALICVSLGLLCVHPSSAFGFASCVQQRRLNGLAAVLPSTLDRSCRVDHARHRLPRPADAARPTCQWKFPLWPGQQERARALRSASGNEAPSAPASKRDQMISSLMAFGAVAGTGVLSWLVEQGGTLLILGGLKNLTGASTLLQVFETLATWASDMGWFGIVIYSVALTIVQLAPVCNGILSAMAIGLMFGTVKGLGIMSFSATASAVLCLLLSRNFGDSLVGGKANTPELFRAIADGISSSWRKTLLLVSLVRLSPVVPFCLSNYLFGLTSVEILPYAVGTWIGTLPGLFVWVSAGVVGKSFAAGGASPPPALIALGAVSTLAVLAVLSKVSQAELAKMSKPPGGA